MPPKILRLAGNGADGDCMLVMLYSAMRHNHSRSTHVGYATMQDTDWDDLRYFLAVKRAGSVSGAARHLRVNHSTVLRRLGNLENGLGVRLFERLPGGYAMTAAGEALAAQLVGVGDRIEAAQRQLSGLDLRLSGAIRLTSTDTLMHDLLMPYLAEFRRAHPDIELQLVINNSFLSLTKREADVAIRPSNKPPEHLIGRRAGRIQTAVYASKAYLERKRRKSFERPTRLGCLRLGRAGRRPGASRTGQVDAYERARGQDRGARG